MKRAALFFLGAYAALELCLFLVSYSHIVAIAHAIAQRIAQELIK